MPKFQAVFDERAARIEGGIAKAEQAQREAEDTKRKYEEQLSQARVEASKIRDDARSEALPHHRRRSFPCRVRSGTDHRQRAARPSNRSSSRRWSVLRGEIGTLATALAGKILGAKLQDNATQSAMIDQMIADLDDDKQ